MPLVVPSWFLKGEYMVKVLKRFSPIFSFIAGFLLTYLLLKNVVMSVVIGMIFVFGDLVASSPPDTY